MASYTEILEALAPETGPVSATTIAEKLKTKVNLINTALTRLVEKRWLDRDSEGKYTMTEEGRKQLSPVTEESEKLTEFQQFKEFGLRVGVASDVVDLTAEHIWRGGNYQDLKWVYRGLTEQGIRADLAKRWWHNWRSFLHQAIPPELEKDLGVAKSPESAGGEPSAETKVATSRKGKRDYILGPNDSPLQVGEGVGDLDYDDAVRLSSIKLAGQARAAASGGGQAAPKDQVSFIQAIAEAFKTFKEATGGNGGHKPIVITQGEDGVKVQEVEPGAPIVLGGGSGGGEKRTTWVVGPDGSARELQPGEPVVIKQPAGGESEGKHESPKSYYIHPDGSVEEATPGKPIVIKQEAPKGTSGTFLNATTPDGKPIVIDIESYFKLEDHKAKSIREQESHELKQDTLKAIKDLVIKGGRALSHVEEG